tara:strand:- start:807 stop:1442 length:636 start_codon:yes stop_codon:yes gene_type:complete
MKRLQENKNLTLVYGNQYRGMPIYNSPDGLVKEYLDRTYEVIDYALIEYTNVYTFRVDINFPSNWVIDENQAAIYVDGFIRAFRNRIRSNNAKIKYTTDLRYIGTREYTQEGRIHYHFMFFVNKNSYHTLGAFNVLRSNLYTRLVTAYARALTIEPGEAMGYVNIPSNAGMVIKRGCAEGVGNAIYRASYLCKAHSKQYHNRKHSFFSSRG